MTEGQNKFDEILKERLSSKRFPFNEENWEQAEKGLDRLRNKEKQRKFFLVFFTGLFFGILLMLPFIKHFPQNSEVAVEGKNEINPGISSSKPTSIAGEIIKSSAIKNIGRTVNHSIPESGFNITYPPNINQMPSVASKQQSPEKESSILDRKTSNGPETNNLIRDSLLQVVDQEMAITEEVALNKTNSFTKETAQINSEKETTNSGDSSKTVSMDEPFILQPQPSPLSKPFIFTAEAGADYLLGWKNNLSNEGKGLNPVLGFGIARNISTNWKLYSGIRYGSVAHLNSSEKTYTTYVSDFGENRIDTIIATKWIHYLVIPFFVQYQFNIKNSLGIGGSAEYRITTSNKVSTKHYWDYNESLETTEITSGYTKGINPWNASIAIGYRRKICDELSLSAEIHYGLMDIKDNIFFAKQIVERNTGIKLLLVYHIF